MNTFPTCWTNVIWYQSINDPHLETNVIIFLNCGTNVIWNQSINSIHFLDYCNHIPNVWDECDLESKHK